MGALTGIRVADFSWGLAGPFGTMILACLGAEVIRVESARRPDLTRRPSPQIPAAGKAPATSSDQEAGNTPSFQSTNRQKLGITLNLQHPEGVALAKALVRASDVVTESFRPGVMERLGLGYDALRAVKPDIIMLSCSFLGTAEPGRKYTGYAPTFAALGGLGELTGYHDGPPTEIRIVADTLPAFTNAFAVIAALLHRQRTGDGLYVDVSCVESIACMVSDSLLDYAANGRVQRRQGNDDEPLAPHNCYPCRDAGSWVSIAVGTEAEWRRFCEAIGGPAWTQEPQFGDALGRWQHRAVLDRQVAQWTQGHTAAEATAQLQRHGVAAAPSFDAPSLFGDPHLVERGVIDTVGAEPDEALRLVRLGGKLSRTPYVVERGGPHLGEHNRYVFGDLLGLTPDRIASLEAEGVFV